jgi:hypothetical protein
MEGVGLVNADIGGKIGAVHNIVQGIGENQRATHQAVSNIEIQVTETHTQVVEVVTVVKRIDENVQQVQHHLTLLQQLVSPCMTCVMQCIGSWLEGSSYPDPFRRLSSQLQRVQKDVMGQDQECIQGSLAKRPHV